METLPLSLPQDYLISPENLDLNFSDESSSPSPFFEELNQFFINELDLASTPPQMDFSQLVPPEVAFQSSMPMVGQPVWFYAAGPLPVELAMDPTLRYTYLPTTNHHSVFEYAPTVVYARPSEGSVDSLKKVASPIKKSRRPEYDSDGNCRSKVERNRGACEKHKRDRKRCPLDCKNRLQTKTKK